MRTSSRATCRHGGLGGLTAIALCATAVAAAPAAGATPKTQSFPTTTLAAATAPSCPASGDAGRAWVAPASGYAVLRLTSASGDWGLTLRDARTGKRLDQSDGFGSNEVVETWVTKGQSLLAQPCRHAGASKTARVQIDTVGVTVPKTTSAEKPAGKRELVSIALTGKLSFGTLQAMGINTNETPDAGGQTVSAVLEPGQSAKLDDAGFKYKLLDGDVDKSDKRAMKADAQAAQAASPLPSGRTTYRHYEDIQADLKKIVADHPAIARPVTLPKKTFQGRDITGVEISSNVAATDDGKPTFFLMGLHHAREWPSAEINVEMALYLSANYGKDDRVTKLLDSVRVVIVPVINVDGYIASREATDIADNTGDPRRRSVARPSRSHRPAARSPTAARTATARAPTRRRPASCSTASTRTATTASTGAVPARAPTPTRRTTAAPTSGRSPRPRPSTSSRRRARSRR